MSKFGFLSVLEEELEKALDVDFAIDWDKKRHAVTVTIVLEAQNQSHLEIVDNTLEATTDDVIFEDAILFYNPQKTRFDSKDYLTAIAYEPKKGLSREFLALFSKRLNDVAVEGLSDLIDFLNDDSISEFSLFWDEKHFEEDCSKLKETQFFPYPRY